MTEAHRPRRWLLGVPLLLALTVGCDDSVDAGTLRTVDASELCPGTPGGAWESAPFDGSCPWIELKGKVAIEVPHGLGARPTAVLVYLSFDGAGADATLASGDVARIVEVATDRVVVANATNQRFFARIVVF